MLDMTLQRGDICPSVLETSKWAQEQAVMLEEEPMGEKPMGKQRVRRRTQWEQGLPPPMYAGSPTFRLSVAEPSGGNDYEVPIPWKSSGLSAAGLGASPRASLLAIEDARGEGMRGTSCGGNEGHQLCSDMQALLGWMTLSSTRVVTQSTKK